MAVLSFSTVSRVPKCELFLQILMNVLRIPAHVTKTLIVLTLRGPTAVRVERDSPEMEKLVKVFNS